MNPKVLSKRQQEFNDEVYWKCGVYFQRYGKRLHRVVWESNNGEIPIGYEIHHIDFDHTNNNLDNLALLPESAHAKLHVARNLELGVIGTISEQAREAAKHWHKSAEGRAWHKKHYENNKECMHKRFKVKCTYCGKDTETNRRKTNFFCSNNCKAAFRRASGVDKETRQCIICGEDFECNKYFKTKTCSKICSGISSSKTKLDK